MAVRTTLVSAVLSLWLEVRLALGALMMLPPAHPRRKDPEPDIQSLFAAARNLPFIHRDCARNRRYLPERASLQEGPVWRGRHEVYVTS